MKIKLQDVSSGNKQPMISGGLRAAKAVCRDRGISDVTLWRWRKRGWVKTANVCGKIYVDIDSLADFDRRAALGEFSQPPAGAAGASNRTLMEKETAQ